MGTYARMLLQQAFLCFHFMRKVAVQFCHVHRQSFAVYTLCTAQSSWWVNNFLICQSNMHGDLCTDALAASIPVLPLHAKGCSSILPCPETVICSVHSVHRPVLMVGEQFPHLPKQHAWGLMHGCSCSKHSCASTSCERLQFNFAMSIDSHLQCTLCAPPSPHGG